MRRTHVFLLLASFLWCTFGHLWADAAETIQSAGENIEKQTSANEESDDFLVFSYEPAKMRFPRKVGKFEYVGKEEYPEKELGVAIEYKWPDVAILTIYVYPAPEGTRGPRLILDEEGKPIISRKKSEVFKVLPPSREFLEEWALCLAAIGIRLPEAKKIREWRFGSTGGEGQAIGLFAEFELPRVDGSHISTIYLYECSGYFIKFRHTYEASRWLETESAFGDMCRALKWPVTKHLKPEDLDKITGPKEQCHIGSCYLYGVGGVAEDNEAAVLWLRKAVVQDYVDAMAVLGVAYIESGQGESGLALLRKAAEQGCADAQAALGAAYASGEGVPKDVAEAVKWCHKAAEQGHAPAQFLLGAAYYSGDGVPKDVVEAVKWCHKAAEGGYALAQYQLGTMYLRGEDLPKDVVEAVKWFRRSAEQGNAEAQEALDDLEANREAPAESK